MSTPTDPYSRPDHEDGHDDILDPLPEPTPPAEENAEEPVGGPERPIESTEETRLSEPAARPLTDDESEVESTQSWKPDFTDEGEAETETDRDRWERAFGSTETSDDEATVVSRSDDATRIVDPAAPAVGTGTYPTRTSVFNRTSIDSEQPVATPPEATRHVPAGTEPRFDHRYEEPIPEEPRGRGWAHVGVFFATLLLAPLAWYLVADAGVRLSGLEDSAWNTGTVDWLVVLELLGALLCLAVLWYLASYSSVGAIVFGLIIAIGGAIAVFAPAFAQDLLQSSAMQDFAGINDFTGNVGHHLTSDMASGRLTVYGFLLFMTGIVSHTARRQGGERGEALGRRAVLLSKKSDA